MDSFPFLTSGDTSIVLDVTVESLLLALARFSLILLDDAVSLAFSGLGFSTEELLFVLSEVGVVSLFVVQTFVLSLMTIPERSDDFDLRRMILRSVLVGGGLSRSAGGVDGGRPKEVTRPDFCLHKEYKD